METALSKMLSSWKEIAHFFGKGVRTVQRWEKTLNLPIRRPPGAPSNVVLARTSDLEAWMHRGLGKAAMESSEDGGADGADLQVLARELEEEVHALILHAGGKAVDDSETDDEAPVAARLNRLLQEVRSSGLIPDRNDHGLRKVA